MSQHYFSTRPEAPHRPGLVRVVLPDLYLELETDAGVFSPGRLDPGTRLLLDEVPPPPPSGDLLDLGCGYGPIACVMAARSPAATVWAVDVNERALELCERNAAKAGLSNVRCVTPGDLPARVAAIWSNPPIRVGKEPLHDLLATWLTRLDGIAHLVVGRNLGADSLARWLGEQGWPTTRLSARSGYRLLQVQKAVYHNGIGTPAEKSGGLGGRSPLRAGGSGGSPPRVGTAHNGSGTPAGPNPAEAR